MEIDIKVVELTLLQFSVIVKLNVAECPKGGNYRMLIRKRLTMLLFFVILGSIAVGCSGGRKAASGPAPTKAPEAVPTEAPAATATPTPTPSPTPTLVPIDYKTAVLKDIYADYFTVGGVLGGTGMNNPSVYGIITTHFNSVTMENEMKPNSLLDYMTSISDPKYDDSPAINYSNLDTCLKFAQDKGLKMRGHTLVWHSQTPRWLFTEGYSMQADAPFVTKELMLKRMENYIRQVLEYCQTKYPGIVYAWDVVNEAIEIGNGHPEGLRTQGSYWYTIIGDDFVEKAFEYARKYADPEVKLFYNDYGTENSLKASAIKKLVAKIQEQGNIDGIGLQTHIGIDSPSLSDIDSTARSLAELGLELQVTELDMNMPTNTEENLAKQGTRYKRLFIYFKKWVEDGIKLTNVTFWGTTDDRSWLNKANAPSYPLLFDKNFEKKPAYYGVLQDPEVRLY